MATNKKKKKQTGLPADDQFNEIINNMQGIAPGVTPPVTPPIPGMAPLPPAMDPMSQPPTMPTPPAPAMAPPPALPPVQPPKPMQTMSSTGPAARDYYNDDIYQEIASSLKQENEALNPPQPEKDLFGRIGDMLSSPEGLAQIGMFGAGAAGDLKGMDAYTTRYSNILEARRAETEAKKAEVRQRMWEIQKASLENKQKRADYMYERNQTSNDSVDKIQYSRNGVNYIANTDRNGQIVEGSERLDQVSPSNAAGDWRRLNDGTMYNQRTGETKGAPGAVPKANMDTKYGSGLYRREDGSAYKVESNSKGELITKPVNPAELTQIQTYDSTIKGIEVKEKELSDMYNSIRDGTTGYFDNFAGKVEAFTGLGGNNSKTSRDLAIKADAINKFFMEDAKGIIGSAQISNADMEFMNNFSGINLNADEATVKKQIESAMQVMGVVKKYAVQTTPYRRLDAENNLVTNVPAPKQKDDVAPATPKEPQDKESKIQEIMKVRGVSRGAAELMYRELMQ